MIGVKNIKLGTRDASYPNQGDRSLKFSEIKRERLFSLWDNRGARAKRKESRIQPKFIFPTKLPKAKASAKQAKYTQRDVVPGGRSRESSHFLRDVRCPTASLQSTGCSYLLHRCMLHLLIS